MDGSHTGWKNKRKQELRGGEEEWKVELLSHIVKWKMGESKLREFHDSTCRSLRKALFCPALFL